MKCKIMVTVNFGDFVMSFRLIGKDCETLESIAEYRILTVSQIAAMFHKNRQVVRRRLREFEEKGLIEVASYEFGRGCGRPEKSMSLTKCGVDLLKNKGLLCHEVPYEKVLVSKSFCINHQLLLNWFRIHLNHVEKVCPRLKVNFMAHNSPFLPKGPDGRLFITDYSPVPDSGEQGNKFTPDAAFGISDVVSNKICLFFLEVDCGTETLASPKRDMSDIRQKIINYQWYICKKTYKLSSVNYKFPSTTVIFTVSS
jgi:DNA-binding PadR family transcriptional regulator